MLTTPPAEGEAGMNYALAMDADEAISRGTSKCTRRPPQPIPAGLRRLHVS